MSFLSHQCSRNLGVSTVPRGTRSVSSSPYGRTHVWRRRAPKLPNPVVPHFPQRVILADGSTFIHWTTSPRPTLKLTRDTTNNPIWNPWLAGNNAEDTEGAASGRLGRFRRKFEELGGTEISDEWVVDSMSEEAEEGEKRKVEKQKESKPKESTPKKK